MIAKIGMMQVPFSNLRGKAKILETLGHLAELLDDRSLDLLVLPELWSSSPFDQKAIIDNELVDLDDLADKADKCIGSKAREVLLGSFPMNSAYGLRNTILRRTDKGEWKADLSKRVPFGFGEGESSVINPSHQNNLVVTRLGLTQVILCFDIRFPEITRVRGPVPEVLIVVASWPKVRIDNWRTLVRARATENQSYVIACNASGYDSSIRLGGNSMIVGPSGELVGAMGENDLFEVLEIETDEVSRVRESFPVLPLREGLY